MASDYTNFAFNFASPSHANLNKNTICSQSLSSATAILIAYTVSFVVILYLQKGPLAFGIGSLLLGLNLAPDFMLSLKLECSSCSFYLTSDELNRRSRTYITCKDIYGFTFFFMLFCR